MKKFFFLLIFSISLFGQATSTLVNQAKLDDSTSALRTDLATKTALSDSTTLLLDSLLSHLGRIEVLEDSSGNYNVRISTNKDSINSFRTYFDNLQIDKWTDNDTGITFSGKLRIDSLFTNALIDIVDTSEIVNNSIPLKKLQQPSGNDAQIPIWDKNVTGTLQYRNLSGDVTVDKDGVTSYKNQAFIDAVKVTGENKIGRSGLDTNAVLLNQLDSLVRGQFQPRNIYIAPKPNLSFNRATGILAKTGTTYFFTPSGGIFPIANDTITLNAFDAIYLSASHGSLTPINEISVSSPGSTIYLYNEAWDQNNVHNRDGIIQLGYWNGVGKEFISTLDGFEIPVQTVSSLPTATHIGEKVSYNSEAYEWDGSIWQNLSSIDDKINYDTLDVISKDTINYPFNSTYASGSVASWNFIMTRDMPAGKITRLTVNTSNTGWLYAFAGKRAGTNKFEIIKEFPIYIRTAGVNEIEMNVQVDETFLLGIKGGGVQIYTSSGTTVGNASDTLWHTSTVPFTSSTTWNALAGRGHNIEIKVETGKTANKINSRKIIAYVGDSITDFCDSPSSNGKQYRGYNKWIAEMINWSHEYIYGYSGYTVTNQHSGSTSGGEILTRTTLWSHADVFAIYLGTNDYNFNRELGTTADYELRTDTTFYGAYARLLDSIYAINPNAEILIATMTKRDYNGLDSWTDTNALGYSFQDYIDAIEYVAKYNGLPIIDLNNEAMFNKKTFSKYTYDNLHPNSEGYKKIADVFLPKLIPLAR